MVTAVDRNTGQPVTTAAQQKDFTDTSLKGPQFTGTTQNTSQTQRVNQTTSQSSYQLNTTPEILATLQSFITSMADRPVVSTAEAMAKFPNAVAKFNPYGSEPWSYTDPVTGRYIPANEVAAFNAQQTAKREQFQQSSGVIKGGTADQRAISDARQQEIERNRVTQGKYTKEAAIADAKGLNDYFTRVLTEQQLPGILRAAEGSGASQGTTRALLTQQAIQRNAESAAKVGIDASTQYGQINNQLAGVLEALTRQDPNSISNQLLNAIVASKGIVQSGGSVSNTQGTTVTNGETNTMQIQGPQLNTQVRDYQDPVPLTAQPTTIVDTYKPSSVAGTGYVQVNDAPAKEPKSFAYAGEDSKNLFFQ